jgi:phosphoglucomutase
LLIGGDGRYYNDVAIQTIIQDGIANGVALLLDRPERTLVHLASGHYP